MCPDLVATETAAPDDCSSTFPRRAKLQQHYDLSIRLQSQGPQAGSADAISAVCLHLRFKSDSCSFVKIRGSILSSSSGCAVKNFAATRRKERRRSNASHPALAKGYGTAA